MFKQQLLSILTILILFSSCSSDDDPRDNYPQTRDITMSVSSSDNERMSDITFSIDGTGIEVSDFSSSDSHLPLSKDYLNKTIPYFTVLNITYRDNSGGAVGVPFEPYNITLQIRVDAEIKAEKEITITESGTVDYIEFIFE
tara:strand:- start:9130 stop:9555 length:426 start_codon:yes stop_codon:yes gene_type:complete